MINKTTKKRLTFTAEMDKKWEIFLFLNVTLIYHESLWKEKSHLHFFFVSKIILKI